MQIQPSKNVVGIEHRIDLRPLTEDEIRFEIDMCIGCDRCMRACPIPMSSTVNIADLNRATISDDIAPHVALFTDECVMCGSCVPVCPARRPRCFWPCPTERRRRRHRRGFVARSWTRACSC